MSGRPIISILISGSPSILTIGDGLNTSTKGTAGVNMRAAGTGVKVAGSKYTKNLVAVAREPGVRHLAFDPCPLCISLPRRRHPLQPRLPIIAARPLVEDGDAKTAGCETFYFDCAMEMERQLRSTGAFGIRDGGSRPHFVHMFNLRMRSYERQFERHAVIMELALGARSCGRRCSGVVPLWATEGRRTNKDKP
jgi:hypothetical protein